MGPSIPSRSPNMDHHLCHHGHLSSFGRQNTLGTLNIFRISYGLRSKGCKCTFHIPYSFFLYCSLGMTNRVAFDTLHMGGIFSSYRILNNEPQEEIHLPHPCSYLSSPLVLIFNRTWIALTWLCRLHRSLRQYPPGPQVGHYPPKKRST